jgi:hypothetical protein
MRSAKELIQMVLDLNDSGNPLRPAELAELREFVAQPTPSRSSQVPSASQPAALVAIAGGHRDPTKAMADEVESEVRAVFERHGMGGVVIAANLDRGGFRPIVPATMHLKLDEHDENIQLKLDLNDEVGVVRTLRFVGAMHYYAHQCSELFEQIQHDIEDESGFELEEF